MRGALRKLALATGSCAIFFGGAEVLLRLTHLAPAHALRSPDLETLEAIPGLFEPGQVFTDRVRRDLPARIRIDNLGFRGEDLSERKPEGVWRVLCLGDSYTFGDHVDDDQTYPHILQEILRARDPGRTVEVVNGGANGFGLLDESIFWREKGSRLDPDAVLLTFSPNDVSDMTRPVPIITQMREHAALKSRPLLGPALRFLQETAVFNALQILAARVAGATGRHDAIPEVEPARAGPEQSPEAWTAYHRALLSLTADLLKGGRRALLVLYPSFGNATGIERPWASEILPAWSAEAGLPCLDLLPAFRDAASRGEVLYLVPRDSHPAPSGHRLAAATIAARMQELGWPAGGERGSPLR